jgi:AcrR family transcriptional regulator
MKTKERIILATLDLAAEHGLKSLSMSQIAEAVGIRKPSLYNHFDSKESLIHEMYQFLREQSKANQTPPALNMSLSAYEILCQYVASYKQMISNEAMMNFYKVIYAERTTNPDAAQILIEETNKMVAATKMLLQYLAEQGKLVITDLDSAAISFAMTIHSLIDFELDCAQVDEQFDAGQINNYIKWFCAQNQKEAK